MTLSIMVLETQPLKQQDKATSGVVSSSKKDKNTATSIIIISKGGTLTECLVEPEDEITLEKLTVMLSKKCGYRNHEGFSCYHTWRYKNKKKYTFSVENEETVPKYIYVDVWGKTDGRPGNENKYEMPPPIDELIFYGNVALVARADKEHAMHLTVDMWNVIYEKLFGGFEDLAATVKDDENETDELDAIPAHHKTSNGYLKDGFVVEDDSEDTTPRKKQKKSNTESGTSRKGRSKKNKSESTESEFITETETESGTPPSDSPTNSDADADADALPDVDASEEPIKIVSKRSSKEPSSRTTSSTSAKPKRTNTKKSTNSKKVAEETSLVESETELSEENYV